MIANGEIQKVFKTHRVETSRDTTEAPNTKQVTTVWNWTCACGQSKILKTEDACERESHNHWAAKIIELLPIDESQNEAEATADKPKIPISLSVLSFLVSAVDSGEMTMPQARRALGEWFNMKTDRVAVTTQGRERMKRLKQITDAMNEEFMALLGSQTL